MGKEYSEIDARIQKWIDKQKMFFVATAPLHADGLINCSPKGMDSLRVLDANTIAYLDLTGSGIETIAHLKENGRICIMLCAFTGPANIIRLQGTGEVLEKSSADYQQLISHFHEYPGARAIIKINVKRISDSCGYAVPMYDYKEDRDILLKWAERKDKKELQKYQEENNSLSLDGLSGLEKQ